MTPTITIAPGVPGTPTAAVGNGQAVVTVTPPSSGGAPQSYTVTASPGGRTCIVLSGGNLDVGLLPNLIRRHETGAGRRLVIVVRIPDRPGALAGVLQVCGAFGANVIEVQHHRDGVELHARETIVQLVLETRGIGHSTALCDELVARGYGVSADLPRGNSPHSAER